MGSCNPDSGTFIGLIFIGLFIAVTGGLISKDKETRRNALIVGMTVSFGAGLFYLLVGCN
jgi:hypothetical protein